MSAACASAQSEEIFTPRPQPRPSGHRKWHPCASLQPPQAPCSRFRGCMRHCARKGPTRLRRLAPSAAASTVSAKVCTLIVTQRGRSPPRHRVRQDTTPSGPVTFRHMVAATARRFISSGLSRPLLPDLVTLLRPTPRMNVSAEAAIRLRVPDASVRPRSGDFAPMCALCRLPSERFRLPRLLRTQALLDGHRHGRRRPGRLNEQGTKVGDRSARMMARVLLPG